MRHLIVALATLLLLGGFSTAFGASFMLGTTSSTEGPAAGSDTVALTVTPEPQAWVASANAPWLHTSASGTLSGNVPYSFDANLGATRTGTLTIAGQTFTVTQAAPVVVTPSSADLAINATTLTITGSGFDATTPGNNTVTFSSGAIGAVTAATATSLTVTFSTAPTVTGSLTAIVTSNGVSSGAAVQVANVVAAPTVTANTANLPQDAQTLIIEGTGFSATPANNLVMLSTGMVFVTDSTATQLTCSLSAPPAPGSLTATVTSNGGSSGAPVQVATIFARPTLTVNTADLAQNAPTLILAGTGFSTTPANNIVMAAGMATVTASTATQLTCTFTGTPPLGILVASVFIPGKGTTGPKQVATIVAPPTVTASTAEFAQNVPTLIITGTNFSTTAANNTVVLSSGTATVTGSTATQLTCTLAGPPSPGSLTAVVTSNRGSSGAAVQVATILAAPTVTASSANLAQNAPTLLIAGTNFSATPANNTVKLSSGTATVTASTATQLTCTLTAPPSLGSLTAVVTSIGGSSGAPVQVATVVPPVSYTVTTTGNAIVLTDIAGNGDTLTLSQPSPGSIQFSVIGRTFSVDGGTPIVGSSGTIFRTGVASITVNAAGGNDTINVESFDGLMPSLTINGGAGDDTVNFTTGNITFAPNANLDIDLQNDSATPGADSVNLGQVPAHILTSGTGTITVKASKSIIIGAGTSFETVNGGITLEANQQALATAGTFSGIYVNGGVVRSTGTGLVRVIGKGGDSTGIQIGVRVRLGGLISGGTTGTTTVTGFGGLGTSDLNFGVEVGDANSTITSAGSNVIVTGTGGGAGPSGYNYGVAVNTDAQITAGGNGTVTVVGYGGNLTGSGGNNGGVAVYVTNARITSGGGNVSVTGTGGGGGAATDNYGVRVRSGGYIATVDAPVTVVGKGGNLAGTGGNNIGILVDQTDARISSFGGVTLTGTGGGGAGSSNNCGVQIQSSATVVGYNNGDVTLIGTGGGGTGGNHGTLIAGNAGVGAANGDISVTGSTTDGTAASQGFKLSNAGSAGARLITGSVGTITVAADSMNISTTGVMIDAGTHAVTLRQKTFGTAIDVGSAVDTTPNTLELSDGELDVIIASKVTIGDAQSGPITVSAFISPATYPTLAFGGNTTFAATGGFTSEIGPLAANIENITVTGSLTILAGATLNMVAKGGFVPAMGNNFQIITNDSTDAITGTFGGLPENQTINPFLGTPINARITYVGGSGNDVFILTNTPPVASDFTITRSATQSVKVSVPTLLTHTSDADGDARTLVSVGAAAHGTTSMTGNGPTTGYVFYTPSAGWVNGDSFTYTITDIRGAQATGTITVAIQVDNAASQNISALTMQPDGAVAIDFSGIPNRQYGLQFKVQLSDPQWTNVGPVTANQYGAGHAVDGPPAHASSSGFYRLVYPAP
jgi:hypothetical protein